MARETTNSLSARPRVWLVRWHVLRTNLGTRHFIGHSVEDDAGCVSTPITSYDSASGGGVTSNGRPYKLLGPPGHDEEAEYVWKYYERLWKFTEVMDVSNEYLSRRHVTYSRSSFMTGNGKTRTSRLYGLRREPS